MVLSAFSRRQSAQRTQGESRPRPRGALQNKRDSSQLRVQSGLARSCPGNGGGRSVKLAQSRYSDVDCVKYSCLGGFSP